MSDWDDEPTNAERTWPDLLELTSVIPDDPLLPLIPDAQREDEQVESLRLFGIGYPQSRGTI